MRDMFRNTGSDPFILNLGTRSWWMVGFTYRPLYSPGRNPRYALNKRLSGLQGRSECFWVGTLLVTCLKTNRNSWVAKPTEIFWLCQKHVWHTMYVTLWLKKAKNCQLYRESTMNHFHPSAIRQSYLSKNHVCIFERVVSQAALERNSVWVSCLSYCCLTCIMPLLFVDITVGSRCCGICR